MLCELARRENGAIIFPRNHAKSTWIAIDTIHDIVYGTEPVVIYVGKTMADAQLHFDGIKHQFENNRLLITVYGNLVPQGSQQETKWTNKHFETTNGVTVIARGAQKGRGAKVKGKRPTKIILDDIEDDAEVRSSEQRKKLHNWVEGVVMQMIDRKRGFVKMVGTVLHPKSELVLFYENYGGIFRKAIENGVPIWWTMPELDEKKRSMGSLLFRQEYMNEPITEAERLVKESWIRKVPPPPLRDLEKKIIADVYGALDPAISEKETADYTALSTVARNRDSGKITVMDAFRDHLPFHEQVRLVQNKHVEWSYAMFGIETVAYQKALKQELDRIGAQNGIYVPTTELVPDKDKVRRFMAVLPYIENGTVEFANTLPQEFFDELLAFPNGTNDDQVDALVNAVTLAIEGSFSLEITVL
jgi:predicted phage terminase large subunit-like protein